MRTLPVLALLLSGLFLGTRVDAQQPPLVYDVEHTGADCPRPSLPSFDDLPNVRPLTDPFAWSDGRGRITDFADWRCRRAEILAEILHYEVGEKPARPADIEASYSDGTLTVRVTENGETLTLTSAVTLPEGRGPFPAIIGMGGPNGSLPEDIFTDRKIARIAFNFSQVMAHTQVRGEQPINEIYPDLVQMGAYSAWPWGVSRIIDGLELVAPQLNIDLQHLGVTGCSFAGKMALFAGALDERIALTIAQEPGGGGAAAWRVSETLGNVETLGNTNFAWFLEDLREYASAVHKLPYDHHELMALVAPRALMVLGNSDYEWLADESGYVSSRAAHEVWRRFGIEDRFGYSIVGGHPHCGLPDVQKPEVEAFVDSFLLGDETANTQVFTHSYDAVNHTRWYEWWGTWEPAFPDVNLDMSNIESTFLEVECTLPGSNWLIVRDGAASNAYVTIRPGMNSTNAPPTGAENMITVPFSVSRHGAWHIFAHVNGPSADDDSFWVRINDEPFTPANGLATNGWQWVPLVQADLRAGNHTLTITYREDGAQLDRINVTSFIYGPNEAGDGESINSCSL